MDSYVDAALRMQARCRTRRSRTLVGNWVHALPGRGVPGPEPRLAPRAGPLLRPLAQGHRERLGARAGRSSGSSASTPSRSRSRASWPGRWRAAAAFPVTGTEPAGRSHLGRGHARGCRRPAAEPSSTRLPPPRDRRARAARCRGAPAARRTASPATSGRTRPRADLHVRAARRAARAVSGSRRSCSTSRRRRPSRPRRPPDRRRPGRDLGAGRGGDPQPDPPASRHRTPRRCRRSLAPRGGPDPAARDRLPVPAGPPDPAVRAQRLWPVIWPSPLPGELRVHHGPAAPSRLVLPGPPGRARRRSPVPAFRTTPAGLREVGGGEDDRPLWRIAEDVHRGHGRRHDRRGRQLDRRRTARACTPPSGSCSPPRTRTRPTRASRATSSTAGRWTATTIDIRARGEIASDEGAFDVRVAPRRPPRRRAVLRARVARADPAQPRLSPTGGS